MIKKIKTFIFALVFILGVVQFKALAVDNTSRTDINASKEWVIKFNNPLNPDTVNNKNINVTDENGKEVPVSISLGSSPNLIIVSPMVSGYEPGKKYNLIVGTNVQSNSGKKLTKPTTLQFITSNKYIDCTSYENLPEVTALKFEYMPLLSNKKQGFFITAKNVEDTQYRIFVKNEADNKSGYMELTNGYTTLTNGKITALKTLEAGSNGKKYKVIIYTKRQKVTGAHKDTNTDYDNYYIDYFRCVDEVDNANTTSTKYNVSLDEMVNIQYKSTDKAVFVETNKFDNVASKNQIKYYTNPNNFIDNYGKYQFLKLNYTEGISVDGLNGILKGKGILDGKGQAFLDAAKNNNIDVAYLVSHSLLETGNGTSLLANGGLKDKDGKYTYGVPVYNFFGIGAYDANPNYYGTKAAYDNKWLTPDDAIKGGANWIASKYINNSSGKQDTLYKMRWNPDKPGQHQYATDISWAFKQVPNIINGVKLVYDQVKCPELTFDIPQFK